MVSQLADKSAAAQSLGLNNEGDRFLNFRILYQRAAEGFCGFAVRYPFFLVESFTSAWTKKVLVDCPTRRARPFNAVFQ